MTEDKPSKSSLSLLQVFFSVCAAFFGVQSQKKQQRDFSQGAFWQYALVALFIAACCVALLSIIVYWIIAYSIS